MFFIVYEVDDTIFMLRFWQIFRCFRPSNSPFPSREELPWGSRVKGQGFVGECLSWPLTLDLMNNYWCNNLTANSIINCLDKRVAAICQFALDWGRGDAYVHHLAFNPAARSVPVDARSHHLLPQEACLLLLESDAVTRTGYGAIDYFAHRQGLWSLHIKKWYFYAFTRQESDTWNRCIFAFLQFFHIVATTSYKNISYKKLS